VRGEALAERYLLATGCALLERRWRPKRNNSGEIDLIVRDGDEIVFVEVKTRRSGEFGFPEESVTGGKRARLRRTASAYLAEQGAADQPSRIDIIAVSLTAVGRIRLRHIRSAVGEED